jgi:hypothetical protein
VQARDAERSWQAERVIANVGYVPDESLQTELQRPEPNYFVLGAKGHGRQQHFQLRAGVEQVREAFAQLTGKPDLDLYRKAR